MSPEKLRRRRGPINDISLSCHCDRFLPNNRNPTTLMQISGSETESIFSFFGYYSPDAENKSVFPLNLFVLRNLSKRRQ